MTMISDPIADLLTRIRNGLQAHLRFVDMPVTKLKLHLLDIMQREGYIHNYLVKDEAPQGTVRVFLKYTRTHKPVLRGLKRVSCSSRRHYVQAKNIPSVFGGMGTVIISTSSGIMTGKEAVKANIGGELLCCIW
jgi:small subunit ribosomal protein S8